MASLFADVEVAPAIEVFALTAKYNEDTFGEKVNLGVGAYRTDDGKPWVLPVVRNAESQMAADLTLNHEYLPVAGLPAYREAAIRLLLGDGHTVVVENKVEGVQTLGGTGALRLAAEFLKQMLKKDVVYVSNPTWGNHRGIFKAAGYSQIKEYRYWDAANRSLDLKGMLEDLKNSPDNSVVILHTCAHNPTGTDPTEDQWKQIIDVCEERKMFLLMDCAYQGFASGDLDKDAFAVRYIASRGIEFFVAQSFSKNFGLYNERTGNLSIITNSSDMKLRVRTQCELIVRKMWSNPSNHGARVVATVLNNPALYDEWKQQVLIMANRIKLMRQLLYEKLRSLGTPGTWEHVIKQIGMFSFTGLSLRQVENMMNKHHIYLLKEGRINMCALTTKNVEYVANAIHDSVISFPDDSKL
ncbi:aspartate aminotransferase, cytoplasmic [Patella vulgata]|uniref:aspartate aminotransferase, cytoplasmic n=1 Tax=Patella vulgata TaxID=6465 RepID=UPI00217F2DBB|nr:aspartate aminotransferase, cytoplasmic [Patella vulgata]